MATTLSKNDLAWNELFKKFDIIQHINQYGYFRITADQIKTVREPRLMTKFDHSVNLPEQFKENQLSILPITRGDYVIAHFDTYHEFEKNDTGITQKNLPDYIESLTANNVQSEAIALSCADASGIVQDFMDENRIISTISGRMGSGNFDFQISDTKTRQNRNIHVENSQIEIDGAYEGEESLAIFEAKMDLSDDFIVRQLYYPYRVWKEKINKPVRPVFFVCSNGIYHLYEYRFTDPLNYNSLELVQQKNYTIEDANIYAQDILDIINTITIVPEPDLPFPQADSFERIINLCELLTDESLTKDDITSQYGFDARQSDYYSRAAMYLDLIEFHDNYYALTDRGQAIMKMDYRKRQLAFCEQILKHEVFNKVARLYFSKHEMPPVPDIVKIMKTSNLVNIKSDATYTRRASTIKCWLTWISGFVKDW